MGIVVFALLGVIIGLITYAMLPLTRKRKVGRLRTVAASIAGSFEGGLLICLLTNQPFTDVDVLASLAGIAGAIAMPRLIDRIASQPSVSARAAGVDTAPPSSPWPRQRRRSANSVPPSAAAPSSRRANIGPPSSKPISSRRTSMAAPKSGAVARTLGRLFKANGVSRHK